MAINLGNNGIDNIYLGNAQVDKIYRGGGNRVGKRA